MRSSFPSDPTTTILCLATIVCAGIALAAPSPIKPNTAGYRECVKLYPDRYCRIENGFAVEPLKQS